ncbi:MAG: hypothetical protein HOK60_01420 [Planctomycetes bacterium]|nr:hypothetical protein [Planctomycetota bacterium]MBT6783636.1 hypothetical protein [Planctomycetota bacterium]
MRNGIFPLLLSCVAVCVSGCVVPEIVFKASPVIDEGQQMIYSDGAQAISSMKINQIVIAPIGMAQPLNKRHHFFIKAVNNEEVSTNLGSASVSASLVGTADFPVGVWSYDDLVSEAKRKRNTALVLTALAGAASAYSASQSAYSYDSGSFSGSDSYGGYYSGSYSGYSYNPAIADTAVAISTMQTAQNMALIESGLAAELSSYGEVLKLTTVFPGYEHGGVLVIDKLSKRNYGDTLRLRLDFGSEIHFFDFDLINPKPEKEKSSPKNISKTEQGEVRAPRPNGSSWKFGNGNKSESTSEVKLKKFE